MAARTDPRSIITQEAFSVAPDLLGLPLARPSRRLAALLLDLLLVAILVEMAGGPLLGLVAAFTFFRLASRALGSRGFLGPKARFALRLVGSVFLFVVGIHVWDSLRNGRIPFLGSIVVVRSDSDSTALGRDAAVAIGDDVAALQTSATPDEARPRARALIDRMRGAGSAEKDVRSTLQTVARSNENEWMQGVVDEVLAAHPPPGPAARAASMAALPPDSLLHLYAAALARSDTPAVDSLRQGVTAMVASDSLKELEERVGRLAEERKVLARQLEEERSRGLLASILDLLDDLGIGFGWTGLYFTAFTALWKGQTPAKRLLGIRVLKLNGQPMTLWGAFERFGGYAAGLLTGLMGFAQVYWDRNRQAIHDKITETVVIRERKGQPAPVLPVRPAATAVPQPPARV